MALGVTGADAGPAPQPPDTVEGSAPRIRLGRVLLVRHAEAGERKEWSGPDRVRPLTGAGRAQAERLAALYDGQPLDRLLTSGYLRCVETMEPLAARRHLPCETVAWLEEGAKPEEALTALLGGGCVVACTHGDVVSGILFELSDRGVALGSTPRMQKGSTWVLEVEDGRVKAARYLAPPA
jgi:8-oxo-dGTP diphosphatase